MTSVELFEKGGPIMYLLLICSLSAVALAIDRFILYRKALSGSEKLLDSLRELFNQHNDINNLADKLADDSSLVAKMVCSVIKLTINDGLNVKSAVDIVYSEAAMLLRSRLNYLSMIVTLSPLLGLLGTIFGMIDSFNIFNLQTGQPMAITGGIGEALIVTAVGLCVAIIALILYTYLSQMMDNILTVLERTATILEASIVTDSGDQADAA